MHAFLLVRPLLFALGKQVLCLLKIIGAMLRQAEHLNPVAVFLQAKVDCPMAQ